MKNLPNNAAKKPSSKLDLRLNLVSSLSVQEIENIYNNQPQDPLLQGIDFSDGIEHAIALVSIQFQGDNYSFKKLSENYGIEIVQISGNIATARVPLFNIKVFEHEESVIFIQLSQSVSLILDRSVPLIGAERLHSVSPIITGKGTMIGVVDKRLDFYHPDFIDPSSGLTRIKSLWIQQPSIIDDDSTRRPAGWSYGVEYNEDDINSDLGSGVPYSIVKYRPEESSHGTHVAGIAIGNGEAHRQHPPIDGEECKNIYDGVTTDAKMIFVDPFPQSGNPTTIHVVDGIDYIFTKAGDVPCVVNLSLAYYQGPHDGSDLQLRRIDNLLTRNGRFVTIGTGNSNQKKKYKEGFVTMGRNQEFYLEVPPITLHSELVEIWYSGDTEFSFEIFLPNGNPVRTVMLGQMIPRYLIPGTTTMIGLAHMNQALNGDNLILLNLSPSLSPGSAVVAGNWKLKLTSVSGDIKWYGYIDENTNITWVNPVSNRSTLSNLATCKEAVSVGNHLINQGQIINDKSGRGPTRDERIKPEISAPGTEICSTRSVVDRSTTNIHYYYSDSGTSMACPHIAGIVSLIFEQYDPNISCSDLKEILFRMADRTGLTSVEDLLAHGWGRARVTRIIPTDSHLTEYHFY
jgi:subtilisin family serine protease